jgi:hypothetical protein
MSVAQDDLADNFDWRSGSGFVGGSMASEIMRSQIHTRKLACFFDHHSSSIVSDWEYPLFSFNPFILDLFP